MLVTAAVNLIPVTESRVARVVLSLPLSSPLGRGNCCLLHKWCGNDSSSCVHIAVPKYNLRSCCPLCQISFWMKTNTFLYKAFYWWYYNIFQKQFIDGSRFRWRWLLRNIRGNIFSPANNWGYCQNIAKKMVLGFYRIIFLCSEGYSNEANISTHCNRTSAKSHAFFGMFH